MGSLVNQWVVCGLSLLILIHIYENLWLGSVAKKIYTDTGIDCIRNKYVTLPTHYYVNGMAFMTGIGDSMFS